MKQDNKKINRSIKIYPLFASFTGDLIFFVPIDTLFLTFWKSFFAMVLYKSIHELAVMFLNMDEIILKNNLRELNRKNDYFKIRNKSKIIYASITLITALVAGKMFNINNYLPMYLSIIVYVLVLGTAFLYYEAKLDNPEKTTKK